MKDLNIFTLDVLLHETNMGKYHIETKDVDVI